MTRVGRSACVTRWPISFVRRKSGRSGGASRPTTITFCPDSNISIIQHEGSHWIHLPPVDSDGDWSCSKSNVDARTHGVDTISFVNSWSVDRSAYLMPINSCLFSRSFCKSYMSCWTVGLLPMRIKTEIPRSLDCSRCDPVAQIFDRRRRFRQPTTVSTMIGWMEAVPL